MFAALSFVRDILRRGLVVCYDAVCACFHVLISSTVGRLRHSRETFLTTPFVETKSDHRTADHARVLVLDEAQEGSIHSLTRVWIL